MSKIENLYLRYKQDVYRYLLSLTHNPTLAEDLLSETFVRAISSLADFKGKSSVKTWLFSMARNVWLQGLRKEKQTVQYSDLIGLYVADQLAAGLTTKELASRIKNLLLEKDERTQKIVNMRIAGYSYTEIAQELTISESTARVIDFRTKKWLKAVLVKEELL